MGAEIPDGAVIVARAIMNSSLWNMRPADRIVALTCVMLCNKRPKKWFDGDKQVLIDCGQFVGSIRKMAKEANLPMQVVRTSLQHLAKSEFLTQESTQWYTVYTVPKYLHYQDLTKYSDSGVRKPTQLSTRDQHTLDAKINTPKPQSLHNSNEGKMLDEIVLRKVSTIAGVIVEKNQHTKNGKSNIKQQQQTHPPSSPIRTLPDGTDGTPEGDGRGVAVVVTPGREPDPILKKICFRISVDLLLSIKMSESCANAFASQKPVGQILRAVQHARKQKRPGGWARMALESDWALPKASGDELREIIEKVKKDVDKANAYFLKKAGDSGVKASLPARLHDEDERTWLRRVSDEIAKRREESSGSKKRKG